MKLKPIITEKSTGDAGKGVYTFRVPNSLTKHQIKKLIEETFKVHVTEVRSTKESGEVKKTISGRKRVIKPSKKALVILKEKEKIDLFETKGNK